MAPSLDGAQERQPLLELQQHDAEVASIAAGAAAPPPAAGPPPDSAGAATDAAAGTAAQPPAAALAQRLLSEKRCRYCLQEEEPGSQLEAPCKCAGSIKVCGLAGNADAPLGPRIAEASWLAGQMLHLHLAPLHTCLYVPLCSGRTTPACSDGWTRSTTSSGALPQGVRCAADCSRAAHCQGLPTASTGLLSARNFKCQRLNSTRTNSPLTTATLPTSWPRSEICGSQFLGDYSAPPQAESPRALLVAQLQVRDCKC